MSIPYGTLRAIADELKNIRKILEKQSTTEQSSKVDICKVCQQYDMGFEDGRLDILHKLSDALKTSEEKNEQSD